MKTKRLLLCALVFLGLFLFSCSDSSEEVVAYGDVSINENMFAFELSVQKTTFLSAQFGTTTDYPLIWSQEINGVLLGDSMKEYVVNLCCSFVYFADYAKNNGGKLTDAELAEIDSGMEQMLSQYQNSKTALNVYLQTYSMNYDIYKEYAKITKLYSKGLQLYYGPGGKGEIPDAAMREYYKENFATVKHIFITTENKGTDASGNAVPLTEEEKASQLERIDNIMKLLDSGTDFDELYALSDDKMQESYPDGYTVTSGVVNIEGYLEALMEMQVGEIRKLEVPGTGTYILKKVELLDRDYANCKSTIFNRMALSASGELIASLRDSFEINREIIDLYSVSSVPVLS